MAATMFFLSAYAGAFVFGFPLGTSSLEMLRLSAERRCKQAWGLAAGVAFANASWALAALGGILPWLGAVQRNYKGILLLAASLVCTLLAWRSGSHRDRASRRITRCSAFWKGMLLGASYPITFGSWVVCLTAMDSFGWRMPIGAPWLTLFFITVFLGYFSYLALLQVLFMHLRRSLKPQGSEWLDRLPRLLLLALSVLFLVLGAARSFSGK